MINIKTTERNGPVVSVMDVTEEDDVVIITQKGILIRQSIRDVSIIGRNTQGVRLINLDDDDRVIDVARVEKEDEEDEELEGGEVGAEENGDGVVIDAPTNGVAEDGSVDAPTNSGEEGEAEEDAEDAEDAEEDGEEA